MPGWESAGRRITRRAPGAILGGELAAVGADDLAGDRQPQAGAAVLAAAGVVQAGEAFEHALAVGRGDAGTVVGNRQDGQTTLACDRDLHPAGGMAHGIVQQVLDGPVQRLAVAAHPGAAVQVQGHLGARLRQAAGDLAGHLAQLQLPRLGGRWALVQPRERQQVLDHAAEPQGVGEHALRQAPPVRPLRMLAGDLELGPHAGQRAAQLVGGVGDEAALAPPGLLEPVEHAVQGDAEPVDLVLGVRQRQPPGLAGAGDLLGTAAQAGDRPKRAADGDPGDPGEQRQQQRPAHQQPDLDDPEAAGDAGDRHGRDHRQRVAGRPRGPGDHPQRVALADAAAVQESWAAVASGLQLGGAQQRHGAVAAHRGGQHPPARVDHLHLHGARAGHRDGIGEAVGVDQGGDVLRPLPGGRVERGHQRPLQAGQQQQRARRQPGRHHQAGEHGEPRPQAASAPPRRHPPRRWHLSLRRR